MKYCYYCNDMFGSPIEALYCINCGALFQANTGRTYKLTPAHEKEIGPYIEYGSIASKRYPYLENNKEVFYMRKEDVLLLVAARDSRITWIHWDDIAEPYTHGTTYFYNRKKIVFIE